MSKKKCISREHRQPKLVNHRRYGDYYRGECAKCGVTLEKEAHSDHGDHDYDGDYYEVAAKEDE